MYCDDIRGDDTWQVVEVRPPARARAAELRNIKLPALLALRLVAQVHDCTAHACLHMWAGAYEAELGCMTTCFFTYQPQHPDL